MMTANFNVRALVKNLSKMSKEELLTRNMNKWESKTYLEKASKYKNVDLLAKEGKENSLKHWVKLLKKYGEPKSQDEQTSLELECCLTGHVPPHFVYVSHCVQCGWVLTPYPDTQRLDSCPWCQSGHTQMITEMIQDDSI